MTRSFYWRQWLDTILNGSYWYLFAILQETDFFQPENIVESIRLNNGSRDLFPIMGVDLGFSDVSSVVLVRLGLDPRPSLGKRGNKYEQLSYVFPSFSNHTNLRSLFTYECSKGLCASPLIWIQIEENIDSFSKNIAGMSYNSITIGHW